MKKSVAKKWIRALKSGAWKKAKGRLGRGAKCRCAIGVLQEIAPKKLPREQLDSECTSREIRVWAGLTRWKHDRIAEVSDETIGWSSVINEIKELSA